MLDSELKDVSFLQFGNGLALSLKSIDHDVFKVVKAFVDPGTTLSLKQRLHYFSVLCGP